MKTYILTILTFVLLAACGGGGDSTDSTDSTESGNASTTYNSEIGAPMSVIGASWTGIVEDLTGTMGITIGDSIVMRFIDSSTIQGAGYNQISTTSWSYEGVGPADGWLTMNFAEGKDDIRMTYTSACAGTFDMWELLNSGSSGSVSGSFTVTGIDCTGKGRLYSNPSTDQWDKTSDGRVGNIYFTNTTANAVDVSLWHPDDGSFFTGYHIDSGQSVYLKDGSTNLDIGNNWGIQVPGQGVVNVSDVASFVPSGGSSRWEYQFIAATNNSAPVANAGPDQEIVTTSLVTLNGTGSSDADGDVLTYSWSLSSKPANSTASLSSETAINPTVTADLDGVYVLNLVVSDGTVSSVSDTVMITATTVNIAPVANAGPDQSLATGSIVSLNGNGSSDANGNLLTYSWMISSKPANSTATLSNATMLNPTFTADKAGEYVLSLVVNDGTVNSISDTVMITATFSSGASFRMPDTGQTTSHTTTFGEDNDYSINPPSYTDNGNGTITDNVTNLVWQKQDDGIGKTPANSLIYCENLTLGGLSDWRLPSRIELISIIDNGAARPAINSSYFPATVSSGYWSSTVQPATSSVWFVGFGSGYASTGHPAVSGYYARCVRGGQ